MNHEVEKSISQKTTEYRKKQKFWKSWIAVVCVMAVLVTAGVNILLRLNGQALNHTKKVLACKYVVHEHTDNCYAINEKGEKALICNKADYVVHTHNEFCYDKEGELVCTLKEVPGHAHDESCYELQKILICEVEETEASSLNGTGTLDGNESGSTTEAGNGEGNDASLNTPEDSEAGLSGNSSNNGDAINNNSSNSGESTNDNASGNGDSSNEDSSNEDSSNGESLDRGDSYIQNLADIGQVDGVATNGNNGSDNTLNTTNDTTNDTVNDTVNATGDSSNHTKTQSVTEGHVHTDACYVTRRVLVCGKIQMHEHTDECYEMDQDGNKFLVCEEVELVAHIHTEECMAEVELTDEEIAALNLETDETEEEGKEYELTYEDEKYSVKVLYHDDANIPEDAELRVKEILSSDEQYSEIEEQSLGLLQNEEARVYVSLDIGFYVDGVEMEPEAEVQVLVQFRNQEFEEEEEMTIIHNEESGSSIVDTQTVDDDGQVSFTTDSFSIYTFTVISKQYDAQEGMYNWYFEYSKNYGENAFLSDEYANYRNDNGALGRVASSFHLVCFNELYVRTDLNGNILAKKAYIQPNDWGTRGTSSIWELSYIQELISGSVIGKEPERYAGNNASGQRVEHMLVVGSSVPVYGAADHSSLSVGGSTLERKDSAAKYIVKDANTYQAPFINLNQVEQEVRQISYDLTQNATQNVFYDFSDQNNRYIYLTTPNAAGYVNIKASELMKADTPIRLLGFDNNSKGSIIINVDCSGVSYFKFPSEAKIYYGSSYGYNNGKPYVTNYGTGVSTNETVDFTPGKVIWNFYNSDGMYIDSIQQMTGAVIAPGASVSAKNMNGTIIAKNIEINGETHRTDFTGTTVPFSAGFTARKTVNGFAPNSWDDTFEFEFMEWVWINKSNNEGYWKSVTFVNNKGDKIYFPEITYNKDSDIGTHWYLVREKEGSNPYYQYDKTRYVIRVIVEKESNYYKAETRVVHCGTGSYLMIQNNDKISLDDYGHCIKEDEIVFNNGTSTEITVKKNWVDLNGTTPVTTNLPSYLEVKLYQTSTAGMSGTQYGETVKITAAENWTYTWKNLPKTDEFGNPVYYYVEENPVNGFEQISDTLYLQGGTYELTNKKMNETTKVTVNKQFFMDGKQVYNPAATTEDNNGYVTCRLMYSADNGASWHTSKFPVTVIPNVGTTYSSNNNGTFRMDASSGWGLTIEGLPKYGVDEKGNVFTYQYKVEEAESTLSAFLYLFDFKQYQVVYGKVPVITGGLTYDQSGYEYIIANEVNASTTVHLKKYWQTYTGMEDSMQQGANADAYILMNLYVSKENGTDTSKVATYKMKSTSIVAVDQNLNQISVNGIVATSVAGKIWEAEVSNLPKYYLRSDGSLGELVYSFEETANQEGFTYGKYILSDKFVKKENDEWVYEFVNRSTETYALPETGGKGTWGYRIKKFFSKLFS